MGEALASLPLSALVARLAARTPAPGGGAAAAAAGAIGCATGAMACRYTTGPKWADRADGAEALARSLDDGAARLLSLADDDAAAYAAVGDARRGGDPAALSAAEKAAAAVPAEILALCALHAAALAAFRPQCNPHLTSDVDAGVRLLGGAGRAAWGTLLANPLRAADRAVAEAHLESLAASEASLPRTGSAAAGAP